MADDPYDEDARFAIHLAMQRTPEENLPDPYDEESRFLIHLQAKVSEQQQEDAEHRQALIHKASLEDEFDEEARFLVHNLEAQKRGAAEEPLPPPPPVTTATAEAAADATEEEAAPVDVTDDAPAPPPPPPPPAAATEDSTDDEEETEEQAEAAEESDGDNTMPDYFLSAVIKDDAQAISTYLKRRPRLLTSVGENGRGPLWLASYHRSVGCVARLLQQPGIQVDEADEDGTSPIHVAVWRHGDLRIVNALRAAGADLQSKPHQGGLKGRTPLGVAELYKRSGTLVALLTDSSSSGSSGGGGGGAAAGGGGGGSTSYTVSPAVAGAGLEELRTRRAMPVWVGPGGSLHERAQLHPRRDEEGEEEDGEGHQGGGGRRPQQQKRPEQRREQRLDQFMPHSTMSLQSQLLTRSRALHDRSGFSSTRVPQQQQHGGERLSGGPEGGGGGGGGGGGVEEEPRGIEGATLGLLDARLHLHDHRGGGGGGLDGGGAASASAASGVEAPSLVAMLDEELYRVILGMLPLQSAGQAAMVCVPWRDILQRESSGCEHVWEVLCKRAGHVGGLPAGAAAGGGGGQERSWVVPTTTSGGAAYTSLGGGGSGSNDDSEGGGGGWRHLARHLHSEQFALSNRWRSSTCIEDVMYLHSDHLMTLQLHNEKLISASADHTIRITDVAGTTLREQADAFLSSGAKSFVPRGAISLGGGGGGGGGGNGSGHTDQVLQAHACSMIKGEESDLLASCSADGMVCIWSLGEMPSLLKTWPRMGAMSVQMEPSGKFICGGEGSTHPVSMYDYSTCDLIHAYHDDEPPLGVTSSLHRGGGLLAAGNTFSRSQLRVWDARTGELTDRFTLPAACRGVRCLQLVPDEHALIAGCANGWIVWCDLRCGRYEKRMAHNECVNSIQWSSTRQRLITSADDGFVKITDTRNFGGGVAGASAHAIGGHKLKRVVFSACCDEERLFAGCDDGTVHVFDYSSAAAETLRRRESGGGLSAQQKRAFGAAVEAARRREHASGS